MCFWNPDVQVPSNILGQIAAVSNTHKSNATSQLYDSKSMRLTLELSDMVQNNSDRLHRHIEIPG